MLCQAASLMGVKMAILDHEDVVGSFDAGATVRESPKSCWVLTLEIEHVDTATPEKLEKQSVHCEPKSSAIMIIQRLVGLTMACMLRAFGGFDHGLYVERWTTFVEFHIAAMNKGQVLQVSYKVTSSWAIALVVGPAFGGFLSQPAKTYPNVSSEESIFGRFPYFLPSFVISVLAVGAYVACIWLQETLHMHHHDKVESLDALEAQIAASNSQDGKAKESGSGRMESTESLLKNCTVDVSNEFLLCLFSS